MSAKVYLVLTSIGIHLVRRGGYDQAAVSWTTAGVITVVALLMPVAGLLVDRFGSTRIVLAGLLLTAAAACPALALMTGHGLAVAAVGSLPFTLGRPLIQVGTAPLFPALLPTSVRLTGVAPAFNLATVAAGGTAAWVATWLVGATGDALSPAYLLAGACLIGLAAPASVARTRARG